MAKKNATPPAEPAGETTPQPEAAPPRGRQTAAPTCPYCKVPCIARRTTPLFTYYYCPKSECPGRYSEKVTRPDVRPADLARVAEDPNADGFAAR